MPVGPYSGNAGSDRIQELFLLFGYMSYARKKTSAGSCERMLDFNGKKP
jgi:hypothetical protein